ncbi:MAG: hypothetical protein R3F11_21010 [Verrucomicrobiales bacterium]
MAEATAQGSAAKAAAANPMADAAIIFGGDPDPRPTPFDGVGEAWRFGWC